MRLTSALFVSAHIRRCQSEGANAAVVRHGADEAGAIFFMVDRLDDIVDLYGPAPQTAFVESNDLVGRLFQLVVDRAAPTVVEERLEREKRFDPDIWVIAIEDRRGRSFLDLAPA